MNPHQIQLLESIVTDENLVICAGLGTGKSQSVLQYIYENKKEKILLIANEKEAQNSYKTGLPDRIILHNTVDKSDYVVRDFKEAISSLTDEQNVLCITKSKFKPKYNVQYKNDKVLTFELPEVKWELYKLKESE